MAPSAVSPEIPESQEQVGTGAQQNTPVLSAAELSELNEAVPLFPAYEQRAGLHDAQNAFIPFSVIEPDGRSVVPQSSPHFD